MKKYMQYILVFLLLFSMTACNESTKSTQGATENDGFNIKVTVPQEKSSENNKLFKTSSEILSILLVVIDSTGAEESHEMYYDGSTWSVDFTLSLRSGPFTFRADAYDVSTPNAGNTPIFTGNVVFDPAVDSDTSINIPLAETEGNVNIRVLPSLTSIEKVRVETNGTILYKFNIINKQGGILNYYVDSVDENGDSCTTPPFAYLDLGTTAIDFDYISGDSTSFSLFYTAQVNCINPVHTLKLTVEGTQDAINIPIVVDDESFNISIAFPPVIESIEVTQLEGSYKFNVIVTDSDSLSLSYEWSLVKGDGTLLNATSNTLEVKDYNQNIGLEVKVKVTDTSSTASSSFVYVVLGNVQSKLKKTGQTKSYNSSGTEVTDASVKDDGFYQKGKVPSYTRDATTQTVRDNVTGLVWQDDEEAKTVTRSWEIAKSYCETKSTPIGSGWRLPTRKELQGLVNYEQVDPAINNAFVNTGSYYYWSSSFSALSSYSYKWSVHFKDGITGRENRGNNFYIRCVRAGE